MKIETDKTYSVEYPFIRVKVSLLDTDGPYETTSWQPGCREEWVQPDDTELFADKHGEMILYVVATFKPGKYPERVFYTRQWKDPDGKVFGKTNLRIASIQKFRRLATGYYYDYRMAAKPVNV